MSTANSAYPPTDGWIAAIHAAADDHEPLGAAVVIDPRRVLTCGHVVLTANSELREPLFVSFPKKTDSADDERRVVVSCDHAFRPPVRDLAVLTLDRDVPAGVELAPLRCPRPRDLVDKRWWAFGFPDRDALGDDADGTVGAALAHGWLRLDTKSRYLIKAGFSGGGLWSPDYGAVVAIVAQAHGNGDGRAITLHQASLSLPDSKFVLLTGWSAATAGEAALAAWGWSLADDVEGARHWQPRARGVSVNSERGYRFRGRARALTEIASWLDHRQPDRQVLVVTGSPGVGKSAVLGRIVTTADADIRASLPADDDEVKAKPGSVACAVHAKGKTALDVATEIARAASAALPAEPDDLAPAIRQALEECDRRFNVVIDALDEATSPGEARAIISKIVLPLAETCSDADAQVVVGTRRHDNGGSLLAAIGRAATVLDLDQADYFATADLAAYALACLQLVGDEREDNPYNDLTVAEPVASSIAELSDKNFLIAGIVTRDHGMHDRHAIDPGDLGFDASVEAALSRYLDKVSSAGELPADQALTALAFAEAPGLPVSLWRTFIKALYDRQVPERQLIEFARSTAANFLIETGADASSGPVFRLFHQALNDALLHRRTRTHARGNDERCIARALIRRNRDWQKAEEYLRRSLPAHAAAAGAIDDLLTDQNYLLYADLRRLVLHANLAISANARRSLQTIGLTPQAFATIGSERASLFSVTQVLEYGHSSYGPEVGASYLARWADTQPRIASAVLEGHQGWVNALCPVTINGQVRLASSGSDGTIRIWDPATGQQTGYLKDLVRALCPVTIKGQTHLATADDVGRIRIRDLATSREIARLQGPDGPIRVLCLITVESQTILASPGDDGTIQLWNPATGKQIGELKGHRDWIWALCPVTINGQPCLASASSDHTVRIWNPATSQQTANLRGHYGPVRTLCSVDINGQPRLASAGNDGTIRIWDPVTGEQIALLEDYQGWVRALCSVTISGRSHLASAGDDGTIRIWDPASSQPVAALRGHQDWVNALCSVSVNRQARLASASNDGTIRIWDPNTTQQTVAPKDHQGPVRSLCQVSIDGRASLAYPGDDHAIRICDSATGQQVASLKDHRDSIRALCSVTVDGQALLAAAGNDGAVQIWNLATSQLSNVLEGHRRGAHALCVITIDSQVRLASSGNDGTIRIWDPATWKQIDMLENPWGGVWALCAITVEDQTRLASAGNDGTIRVWDPATNHDFIALEGHRDWIWALCQVSIGGRVHLASAGNDSTIRIWDPATGEQADTLEGHQGPVRALCEVIIKGSAHIASAGNDGTVRIWDPTNSNCLVTIPVHHRATALASLDGALAVGLSAGVLVIDLNKDVLV